MQPTDFDALVGSLEIPVRHLPNIKSEAQICIPCWAAESITLIQAQRSPSGAGSWHDFKHQWHRPVICWGLTPPSFEFSFALHLGNDCRAVSHAWALLYKTHPTINLLLQILHSIKTDTLHSSQKSQAKNASAEDYNQLDEHAKEVGEALIQSEEAAAAKKQEQLAEKAARKSRKRASK